MVPSSASDVVPSGEIKVSFGYDRGKPSNIDIPTSKLLRANSSFSRLSAAALSANPTLANTDIGSGLITSDLLPSLDSPTEFRRIPSSPSLSKMEFLSSSLQSNLSILSSPSSQNDLLDTDSYLCSMSRSESFLSATEEVHVAGGAAGEDRVQAVCSEENGWLFCGVYDGFNGRDAADYLAGTLYETVACHLNTLEWDVDHDSFHCVESRSNNAKGMRGFNQRVLESLQNALSHTEDKFLNMVEQEMEERPHLVSIGSCVLLVLLHGKNLYVLNVGDSRAVVAIDDERKLETGKGGLRAVQLTDSHNTDNEAERIQLEKDHPDDASLIRSGKIKGKLKVTRAFGVGYLKKKNLNDALMGILKIRDLTSPPYVSLTPSLSVHEVSDSDHFVVLGSDGLFDFFSNEEVINLVYSYISKNPFGDPAKFVIEQLVTKAADSAGFSTEELMNVPAGRRRKYHDDVTVIVIVLGTDKRTSKASTFL